MKDYVVVDLETTGLDPYKGCEIIEIGITEIINGKIGKTVSISSSFSTISLLIFVISVIK